MFPIRDHNPSRRTPYVTWALIATNVLIFVTYWTLLSNDRALAHFFFEWGLVPAAARPETFVTSMFLHGGLMHLGGNMLFLWVFGDNMEDAMGHVGFLIFYLAGGLIAAGAQFASNPASMVPMVGASGAIAGVMGGYLLLYPKARVDILIILIVFIRVIPVPAYIVLGAWFAIQVVQGSIISANAGGVAYWAHAGGYLAGLILTLPIWFRRGATAYWQQTDGHPPHPDSEYRWARTSVPRVRR
ncbi:MAG: rhomboid family intramembrane serine protease [Boseongicola sp.]